MNILDQLSEKLICGELTKCEAFEYAICVVKQDQPSEMIWKEIDEIVSSLTLKNTSKGENDGRKTKR